MKKIKSSLCLWQAVPNWKKTLILLLLGSLTGIFAGDKAAVFQPLGNMFLNAIHLLVVPIVFTTIVCSVLSLQKHRGQGEEGSSKAGLASITGKAAVLYILTMFLAATIGVTTATLIAPGVNFDLGPEVQTALNHITKSQEPVSLLSTLEGSIPPNPISALLNGNILQIIVFGILMGVSINQAGRPAQPIADAFFSLSKVVFRMAHIIMSFAPYGIFALIASTFGRYGLEVLSPLFTFILTVFVGCLAHIVLVYCTGLLLIRINPLVFFRHIFEAMIMAFTTSSSAATLPVSMRCTHDNLKISKSLANFLLPLGTNFNLNGLTIYLSASVIFAANIYHHAPFSFADYVTLISTTVLLSMGVAAVPSSALIVMSAIMSSISVPLGAIPLIAGVDRFNDMMQTTTSVIGDIFVCTVVAKTEGDCKL